MWLLDANMDIHLVQTLREFGIDSDTADNHKWKKLFNGELVSAAVKAGFTCLLTRDQRFGESAAKALKAFPVFAVVIIRLPQVPREQNRLQFLEAWRIRPIEPIAGRLIHWPK
jgi:predicted nuclease of predicted toxin-antitoxin system